jgi:HK97 family phage major capsid protein
MKINFPITITAADTNKRTISGTIVSWNEAGNTSAGKTVFAKDSIDFSKPVKLLLEHDKTRPLGKLIDITANDQGLEGTFKLAKTFAADDALEEAATGLRDGFSVGVMVDAWDNKDGAMVISKSSLQEVSLVSDPAIASAKVESVVATNTPENSEATAEDQTTQEDKVSDITSDAPIATEAVEAAKSEPVAVVAAQSVAYTKPRSPITNKATYLEHSVRAALGNDESRQYVMAADTTSNNSGLIPTPQATEIINGISNGDRGSIDAISRGVLPASGMTFEIPKITAAPTVTEEAEGATIDENDQASSFVTVNVKKFAGRQTFSVELLDRSSPAFFDELVRQMEFAYAKETDKFVANGIISSGLIATTAQDNTAAGLLAYAAQAAQLVYSNSLGFARNIVVSPEQWGNIMGYNDSGRPIYNASNPQNAGGAVGPQSLRGNVAGLDLYVSRSLSALTYTTGDGSMFVINPEAYTWYESPRLQLRSDVTATGQVSVAYYGYGALATKIANGSVHFNKN